MDVENPSFFMNVKKLDSNAIIPKYGSTDAAGMDLYALLDEPSVEIKPNETMFIRTGISMAIPKGFVGLLFARSGIACKRGLAPANKVGVIDSDYRGEIMVALHNHSKEVQTINNQDRIAQLAIVPFVHFTLEEVDDLDDTERGSGGFGSTGIQ